MLTTVALTLLTLPQVAAQDLASQLVGVWKYTGFVQKEAATGATVKPRGEKPTGSAIFTRGGYFTWIIIDDGRKSPPSPMADADRVALFNSMGFGSGTYTVDGTIVSLRYDSSWNQSWTGTERKQEMKVTGKTLTWTTPTFKLGDGKEVVFIFTSERVE